MTELTREEKFMKEAIKEARKARRLGEVPIGCVIVQGDEIIGRGYNRRMTDKTVLAHAEISAIKKACRKVGDWRLDETEMYVTLEPCQMCAGAIIQARIRRVYVGAMNPKAGCTGSIINLFDEPKFNHHPILKTGILADTCSDMLKEFFAQLRRSKQS
ncbi:MAG: tRNA adenosine(34) deaminase TadA [Lachnospiraceae bacterium]|nr:tRNA adenosine(34) deaminase TadA [Lachnospiraceae bacterium]